MSVQAQIRVSVEYALVRMLVSALGSLPRPAAIAMGRWLGRIAFLALSRLRRIGERNLSIAFPQMDRAARLRILRGCFDNLGRQLGEFCHFPKTTPESLRQIVDYDAESVERLEAAKKLGRGILFITAHLGAWELLPFAHSAFGNPLSFLARPIDNPLIEQMVHSVRTKFGNQQISKQFAGLTCMRTLKRGGILGILADLNSLPQEGIFVPFFGELACSTAAVAALALTTDAIVFPAFAPWNPARKKYTFRGGPPIEVLRTGDHERDLGINTARIASVIEKVIRKYPDQWLWIHNRWHARPRPQDRVCTDFPPVDP
jgi:KDO2-lipid IV(A) lauroyltransferase